MINHDEREAYILKFEFNSVDDLCILNKELNVIYNIFGDCDFIV